MVDDLERDSAGNLPANAELTKTFLKLSGYQATDIFGSNEARRSFVTTSGGKYVVAKTNKSVRVLQGPPTPNQLKRAAEKEETEE